MTNFEGGIRAAAFVSGGFVFDPVRSERMVERNFELGREHFSYDALEKLFADQLGL